MRRTRALGLALALSVAAAFPVAASVSAPAGVSRLGFRRMGNVTAAGELLAQRTIDRQWGLSQDSVYVAVDVPGWKSPPLAATLSAVVPGAGQAYSGEHRAWVFAAVEAAGWGGWWWYRHDASRLRADAAGLAGSPTDPEAGWSYDRWATATGGDPTTLVALYAADKEAFYDRIGADPTFLAGWQSEEERSRFGGLRAKSDTRLAHSRIVAAGLWINHLVAAVNALRAARAHDVPLSHRVGLRVNGHLDRRGPAWTMSLERRF
ncbi:MAG: hypothetical protein E6K81_07690 [Candidatus Eisenbacteria bacterium]|uniref:DUF5683 domain-containing protein n=1 Tax=Eiseniibacteriota bacterium TaxID=2212470 RepID=A0A538U8Y6_UNCEI|nr:MAG: hypothetical protein E6K81_07690 [Candidatus Eisenbacteria bacterium]